MNAENHQINEIMQSFTNAETNWRQENIMPEVVVKLSAMHLGGRKRVLN